MARCYRVTAELVYYVHARNEDHVYEQAESLIIIGDKIHSERVTVSTVLEVPGGN